MQYGALTTSGILPYAFDNVFNICLCVKRNADSAVRCSSKSLGQGRIDTPRKLLPAIDGRTSKPGSARDAAYSTADSKAFLVVFVVVMIR